MYHMTMPHRPGLAFTHYCPGDVQGPGLPLEVCWKDKQGCVSTYPTPNGHMGNLVNKCQGRPSMTFYAAASRRRCLHLPMHRHKPMSKFAERQLERAILFSNFVTTGSSSQALGPHNRIASCCISTHSVLSVKAH